MELHLQVAPGAEYSSTPPASRVGSNRAVISNSYLMAQISRCSAVAGVQWLTATVAEQVSGCPSEGLRPWHLPRSSKLEVDSPPLSSRLFGTSVPVSLLYQASNP